VFRHLILNSRFSAWVFMIVALGYLVPAARAAAGGQDGARAGFFVQADTDFVQADTDTVRPAVPAVAPQDSLVPAAVEAPAEIETEPVPIRPLRRREETKRPAVWWVTVRSGILPGWGQLANRKPVKAAILAGVYTGWAVGALMAESDRRDIDGRLNGGDDPDLVAELNDAVDRRNFRMWMMGATMIYAMLDAYVDAHFRGYDETWSFGVTPDEPGLAMTVRF
jgi:hypothetical protein